MAEINKQLTEKLRNSIERLMGIKESIDEDDAERIEDFLALVELIDFGKALMSALFLMVAMESKEWDAEKNNVSQEELKALNALDKEKMANDVNSYIRTLNKLT